MKPQIVRTVTKVTKNYSAIVTVQDLFNTLRIPHSAALTLTPDMHDDLEYNDLKLRYNVTDDTRVVFEVTWTEENSVEQMEDKE